MLGRRVRSLSQRNYMALQALHAEAERLRQIDRGLGYGHATPAPKRPATPVHVGPAIEAVRNKDGWAA